MIAASAVAPPLTDRIPTHTYISTQLDGVKRAMDVIRAANEQMAAVRGEFEGMHELCRRAGEQGRVLFDGYPRLRMVNRARKNLERTLKEVSVEGLESIHRAKALFSPL